MEPNGAEPATLIGGFMQVAGGPMREVQLCLTCEDGETLDFSLVNTVYPPITCLSVSVADLRTALNDLGLVSTSLNSTQHQLRQQALEIEVLKTQVKDLGAAFGRWHGPLSRMSQKVSELNNQLHLVTNALNGRITLLESRPHEH